MRNVCVLDRVAHMEENCGESRLTVCYCVLLCVTVRYCVLLCVCSSCVPGVQQDGALRQQGAVQLTVGTPTVKTPNMISWKRILNAAARAEGDTDSFNMAARTRPEE